MGHLANVHQELGNYEEAERLYKRSLEICEKQFGPEHVQVADSLGALASFYGR